MLKLDLTQLKGMINIANKLEKGRALQSMVPMVACGVTFIEEVKNDFIKYGTVESSLDWDEYCQYKELADFCHVVAFNMEKKAKNEPNFGTLAGFYFAMESAIRDIVNHSMTLNDEYSIGYMDAVAKGEQELDFIEC